MLATLPPGGPAPPADALPLLLEKLSIEGTRLAAARAFAVIARARAPVAMAGILPQLLPCLQSLLRKAHRGVRHEALRASAAVLDNYGGDISDAALAGGILDEAVAMVSDSDLLLAAAALDTCVSALRNVPQAGALPGATAFVDAAVKLSQSTVMSGAARASLNAFCGAAPGASIPGVTFDSLRARLLDGGAAAEKRGAQRGVAECVAALCAGNDANVKSTVELCVSTLKGGAAVHLSSRFAIVIVARCRCACNCRSQSSACSIVCIATLKSTCAACL